MRVRPPFRWPEDKARIRRRAIRLEWITLGAMATVVTAMFFTVGNSQAMRTALIEDLLGFVPAIAFLVAAHVEQKPPSRRFPLGHYRALSIAYLVGATATCGVGLVLLFDSASSLLSQTHPSIGQVTLFGEDLWLGWLMIAALLYSAVPPVVLGRMKLPLAKAIHDKVLISDAAMQKADWMTALAGILGIVGIGFGLWWADAAAALVISLDVARDGGRHVWRAVKDLADEIPRTVDRAEPHPAIAAARRAALACDWVAEAEVELREEGHLITGTVYVVPRPGSRPLQHLEELRAALAAADWRLYETVVALLPPEKPAARSSSVPRIG